MKIILLMIVGIASAAHDEDFEWRAQQQRAALRHEEINIQFLELDVSALRGTPESRRLAEKEEELRAAQKRAADLKKGLSSD